MSVSMHELTLLSASQLAAGIADGSFTSREVTAAHLDRIEATHSQLNAVVCLMRHQALTRADALDRARSSGELLGPLHGVPVTIKEMFDVAGQPTTAGIGSASARLADRDSPLVARLQQSGAVLLGKTNAPQMGLLIETDNPVYGRTNNPWQLGRSPAGSSGGEAAIVAAGGSPLGLGSDGGGSIRIPAHVCGICGLKPTAGRLTMDGHWHLPSFPVGCSQPGPIARTVEDLALAMRVLTTPETAVPGSAMHESGAQCPSIPPLDDYRRIELSKLRIGYYESLEPLAPSPAIRRAVRESADVLRAAGATVQPFAPAGVTESWHLFLALLNADGGFFIRRALSGSKSDWRIRRQRIAGGVPSWLRPAVRIVLESAGQLTLGEYFRAVPRRSVSAASYLSLLEMRAELEHRFREDLDAQRLDVLIGPPGPTPAVLHGSDFAAATIRYTALYNLVGMPAGVVPWTKVRADEECDRLASRDVVSRQMARIERGSVGLPVGVQVVGRHWRESVVLAVMAELQRAGRELADFPRTPVDPTESTGN